MAARQGVEHWGGHVEDWRASGLIQIAYCAHHGLNIKSFRRWRTKLQQAVVAAPSLTLVPISVGAPATAPAIRLHSPDGWRIELATANPAWLADLARHLP